MEQDLDSCDSIENFTTDYKMMMTLGEGHFSVVKMAYHIPSLTCVAIKHRKNVKKYTMFITREVNIIKSFTHPNIIKLFQVVQTRKFTYPVMEHNSQENFLDLNHGMWVFGGQQSSKNIWPGTTNSTVLP